MWERRRRKKRDKDKKTLKKRKRKKKQKRMKTKNKSRNKRSTKKKVLQGEEKFPPEKDHLDSNKSEVDELEIGGDLEMEEADE